MPHYSIGSEVRETFAKDSKSRPGPMDYNPQKINLLKKAPRVIMPLAARMGSAPNGRGRMKMKLKLNSSRDPL